MNSIASPEKRVANQTDLLLNAVREMRVPFGFERSFRLTHRCVLGDRYLITMDADVAEWSALQGLLTKLRYPVTELPLAYQRLAVATHVHLGIEVDQNRAWYKIYFERSGGHYSCLANQRTVVYLATKWDATESDRWVATEYSRVSYRSEGELIARIAELLGESAGMPCRDVPAWALIDDLLDLLGRRAALNDVSLLEVVEREPGRRSMDLNVYDSQLAVGELAAPLQRLCTAYEIPAVVGQRLLDVSGEETLGHVAAGRHRDGASFVTFYHGVDHELMQNER